MVFLSGPTYSPWLTVIFFIEVAESGRGEIVNDLDKDARWSGELPALGL